VVDEGRRARERVWNAWGPRLQMKELCDPFENKGNRRRHHFNVGAKGGRCRQDSFMCLQQEGMNYYQIISSLTSQG
jgi:hypothetical protein